MVLLCRLCVQEFTESVDLYNSEGETNEVYEITAKYFRTEYICDLNASWEELKHPCVLCSNCWKVISDFHTFQKTIQRAQEQYEHLTKLVKQEVEIDLNGTQPQIAIIEGTVVTHSPSDDSFAVNVTDTASVTDVNNENVSLNNLKSDVCNMVYSSDSDEEKPLLMRIKASTSKLPRRTSQKLNSSSSSKRSSIVITKITQKSNIDKKGQLQKTIENDQFIAEHWKRELPCDICGKNFDNFTSLRVHFRKEHDNKRCYVVCCERKYYHRFHLIDHLNIHFNPNYFACPECGKCSANRRSLANHMKWSHSKDNLQRDFECHICHKRFFKKAVLQGHMDVHATGNADYACPHCDKRFVLENRLNIHIRNVHNTENGVCELCGKSFRCRYTLKAHILWHQGVQKRKWPCEKCGAELNTKFSLGRHKQLHHNDGSTVYVCSECGKISLTEQALRSHKKYVHEKERKYKCTICEKAFKVSQVLKEHMTTHTGEDLYKCPHCPKTFKVNANMHHHRKRVHPKEWQENRVRRSLASQIDLNQVSKEIIL